MRFAFAFEAFAQSGKLTHLAETFPEHIGEEADHDVGLYPVFPLVPDRPELQILFVNAEGRSWLFPFGRGGERGDAISRRSGFLIDISTGEDFAICSGTGVQTTRGK